MKEKTLIKCTAVYHGSPPRVVIRNSFQEIAKIEDYSGRREVTIHSHFYLEPREVADADAFLTECIEAEEREKLSKITVPVEFTFEPAAHDMVKIHCASVGRHVSSGGTTQSILRGGDCGALMPPEVIAAARKFAGWDK